MATRNRAIVPRYGPGERPDPAQRWPGTASRPATALGVAVVQVAVGPSACVRGYEANVAGCAPYDSTPWRDVPGRRRERCSWRVLVAERRRRARSDSGVSHRSGRRRRRPTDRRPTPTRRRRGADRPTPPTTDAPDDRAATDAGRRRRRRPPTDAGRHARLAGRRRPGRRRRRVARGARRLRRPRRADVRAVRRPPPGRRPGEQDRLAARQPGGPGFGGSDFAVYADQIYGEELLERFDIVGWDPRGTGLSEPAIDCIDDYDRYFAGTDITPDDDAERQQLVDLAEEFADDCVAQQRRHLRARRHEQQRPRHGHDPPGARRGRDQLLRLQLRQRARRDVGDAVPRHRAGRRARRRQPTPTPSTLEGSAAADRRASRGRSTRTSPRAAPTRRARSTTTATPRARSTR